MNRKNLLVIGALVVILACGRSRPPGEASSPATPTVAQVSPTSTPVPNAQMEAARAAQVYLDEIKTPLAEFAEASTMLGQILQQPNFDDQAWRDQVTENIEKVHQARADILAMTPPPEMQEVHDFLNSAMADCDAGATLMSDFLSNSDGEALVQGLETMDECNQKFDELSQVALDAVNKIIGQSPD